MATGQVARGLLIATGILGLFFGGIFIGGIDVVDSQEDRVWFLGEALVGPIAFGIDSLHQNHFKAYDEAAAKGARSTDELDRLQRRSAYPDEMRITIRIDNLIDKSNGGKFVSREVPVFVPATQGAGPPNKKSIAKVNELGTLFSTIAGMMNLIALIDAAFPSQRRKPEPTPMPTVTSIAGGRA
jgi:hypothetical protein